MPSGGLTGYINRADGPSRPASANSKRQAAVANAKVQVPKTRLQHEPPEQHFVPRRQQGINQAYPAGQPLRESGETFEAKSEIWGTDAGSSIDTTIHESSLIKGDPDQRAQEQEFAPNSRYGEDDDYLDDGDQSGSEGSYEDDGSERDEPHDQHEDQDQDQIRRHDEFLDEAGQLLAAQGLFLEGNSYPSTTSGLPDEVLDQWDAGRQLPVHQINSIEAGVAHLPQAMNDRALRQVQPLHERGHPPSAVPQSKHATTIYERGAAARATQQHANASLHVPRAADHTMNTIPGLANRPQNYDHNNAQAFQSANPAMGQQSTPPASQTPHRSMLPPSVAPNAAAHKQGNMPPKASKVAQQSSRPQTQAQLKEEPAIYYHMDEEFPMNNEGPILDYETPTLFDMSYDQLRDEDFDTEPRGRNEVLSNDMQQRALIERLVHVHKNLNSGDQEKFFRALPTREWEDAGDWFLDRFSNIIQRAKEARQNKRKIARKFEDEVERRYRRVAKRQRNVETALGEMKEKGQGLIPKSPRASKEAVSRTPRSRKR